MPIRDYMARHADCPGRTRSASEEPRSGLGLGDHGIARRGYRGLREARRREQAHIPASRLWFLTPAQRRIAMHAASCIATVAGHWPYEGGGAFHNNGAIYHWRKSVIEGLDALDMKVRKARPVADRARPHQRPGGPAPWPAGQGDAGAEYQPGSPVAPEQELVKQGFAREDLFVCVHEQFMDRKRRATPISCLPATMFMEHDDLYQGGGHQYIQLGMKLIDSAGPVPLQSRGDLRPAPSGLGAKHEGFTLTPRELIERTLADSGWGAWPDLEAGKFIDAQPSFERAHFINGFGYRDGKFRFRPDWPKVPAANAGPMGPIDAVPGLAGSLGSAGGGECGISVPPRHQPRAAFPQFQLHRNPGLAQARRPSRRDDSSGGCRAIRRRGRWMGAA